MPSTFSYSAVSDFENCPKKYKLKRIDRLPTKDSPALVHGNERHAEAELYLTSKKRLKVPEPLSNIARTLRDSKKTDDAIVEEMWIFDANWNLIHRTQPEKHDPRSMVFVKMDWYSPSRRLIRDWKTGKTAEHDRFREKAHREQGSLYALAAMLVDDLEEVDVEMVYIDHGLVVAWTWTADDIPALLDDWTRRGHAAMRGPYPATPNPLCSWCDFNWRKGGPCRAAR